MSWICPSCSHNAVREDHNGWYDSCEGIDYLSGCCERCGLRYNAWSERWYYPSSNGDFVYGKPFEPSPQKKGDALIL